jgi:hypothetical protein
LVGLRSLSKLINKRGRSVIQIIEGMPLTVIINPSHQYFSGLSCRAIRLGLGSVVVECGYKPRTQAVLAPTVLHVLLLLVEQIPFSLLGFQGACPTAT